MRNNILHCAVYDLLHHSCVINSIVLIIYFTDEIAFRANNSHNICLLNIWLGADPNL